MNGTNGIPEVEKKACCAVRRINEPANPAFMHQGRGAQRHGHSGNLLTSSARPKQLVEQVAEPRLEHIDFSLRYGDALMPVVGDGPVLDVVF